MQSSLKSWEEARRRLVPVIGESGFRIIFARSLHVTRREHPWLAMAGTATDRPLDDLMTSLAGESPERAQEANQALNTHFIELLHALIGQGLTNRLLDPVPPPPSHGP